MSKITAPADGGALPESLPTRRAALGALASFAALGVPGVAALAAPVDPVFAAIERHREAEAAFVETINPADETWCKQNGLECTDAARAALEAAEAASEDALDAMLETTPLTIAGLRALFAYIAEIENLFAQEYASRVLPALLRSPVLNG